MTDALKKVLEGISLSDSAKAAIADAWETKLQEAREDLAATLRDEFALKYEKDRNDLVEAMEAMIGDTLKTQVEELAEAKKATMAEKVKTKKKMKEAIDVLHGFIKEHLTKEVQEFRENQLEVASKVSEIDKLVNETLTKELEDYHDERRKLAEDRVQNKINAKKELAEARKKMIGEMATICEKFIREHLTEEMGQLKGELSEAKKKHFGMKVFEAFAAEYGSSFFNERKEISKLLKVVEEQNKKIKEAFEEIAKRDKMVTESTNKLRIVEDRSARTKQLNELCGSLTGSKRKLMLELLEKCPTNKLTESFKIYLPSVLEDGRKPTTAVADESQAPTLTEVTGDKDNLMSKGNMPENKKVINEVVSKLRNMETYSNAKSVI